MVWPKRSNPSEHAILGSNVKFNVSRSKFKFSSLRGPIAGLLLPVSFDPKGFGIHAILQVHDELYDWQLECSTVVGAQCHPRTWTKK